MKSKRDIFFATKKEALIRIDHVKSQLTFLQHPVIEPVGADLINLIEGALNTIHDKVSALDD